MNDKGNKKQLTILIILAALILIGIVFLILNKQPNAMNPFQKDDSALELDSSQGDYVEPVKPYQRNIVLPGWTKLIIEANTTDISSGINFYNPTGNKWYECKKCHYALDENYKCINEQCGEQYNESDAATNCFYMTFSIYLKENNECIYESKLVEPNKHIQHITLTRPLEKGEYEAYVFIQPYLSDMKTPCNNGRVDIKLIAQ